MRMSPIKKGSETVLQFKIFAYYLSVLNFK